MTQGLRNAGTGVFGGVPTFTLRHRLSRALFQLVWMLCARWTPPPAWRWRRLILRAFGAEMAPDAVVYASARIWLPRNLSMGAKSVIGPRCTIYCMDRIEIGRRAVISQGAHLCSGSHDVDDPGFALVTQPIRIGDHAWICAEAFVGPGVIVGKGAVLGARGVAFRDLPDWTVHAGNPARQLRRRTGPSRRESLPDN
ncbi:acetyltransferase [Plastorhodobacter daqingensis]|uniref:Acetyltransferase n=1 Tax=Plastorhodobacter daqingensis TaxID=1387281 RepID=A0ABW2UER5_9RHOB